MPKTITDPQIIGAQGQSLVAARANEMGFMISPYGPVEAGIDHLLEIRDPRTGRATGQLLAVQVKTTEEGTYTAETAATFEYMMREEDLRYWQGCNLPVIVVLVHLARGTAYWKSVDSGGGPTGRRLYIDKARDSFDVSAREAIAGLCVEKAAFGVHFPRFNTGEPGHLNMLRVVLPERIYVAPSPFKTGRKALDELLAHEDRPPDDWIIRSGQFTSFTNPADGPLAHIVDTGSIEPHTTDEIAFPDEEADEHAIIELLRRTLCSQLDGTLSYSRAERTLYFPAVAGKIERVYSYQSVKKSAAAMVVKRYYRDNVLKYVRHHAFEPRFWRIDEQWFLSMTPTFHFTWDGYRPDRFASTRLAGKKQLERNSALIGQLSMWRHLLVDGEGTPDLFEDDTLNVGSVNRCAHLRFEPLDHLELTPTVPDQIWLRNDPTPPSNTQESLFQ